MSDFSSIDDRLRQMYGVLARAGTGEQPPAPATPPVAPPQPPPLPVAPAPMPSPLMPTIDVTQPILRAAPAERSVVGSPEARARAIIAAAEEEAAHVLDDARRQVRELSHQIDALISLRDQLRAAPTAPAGPAADPGPDTVVSPPVAAPPPSVDVTASLPSAAAPAPPITASPAVAPAMTPPAPAAAAPPGSVVESRQFGSLGGVVTMTVGPFSDAAAIEQFESALVTISELNDVYLRAYESGRAIFELTLHRPAALLGELIRVSPEALAVVQESARALVISVRGLTPNGRVQP